MNLDLLFLVLTIVGIVVALIVGYLQLIVPFVKGEVKLSKKFPFVTKLQSTIEAESKRARKMATAEGKKSIVVLPFDNLGKSDDDYFAAGVTEEITSRLAVVRRLAVISRTSASKYVKTKKTISQIGDELCVEYVLEGTVRWARTETGSDRVRITPKLIRVSDDTYLWADSYDRHVEDIFEIQTDIAQRVVEQLDLRLGEKERTAVEAKPTVNIDAYHAYLRARYYATRPHFSLENWQKVFEYSQEAVKLDPNFVNAHVELSKTHSKFYFFWYDHSEERRRLAKQSIDRALSLAPQSPQVRLALAYYYLWCHRDAEKALREVDIAERGLPNNSDVLETRGNIFELQGKWEQALEVYRRAYALSPREASLPAALAGIFWMTRKYTNGLDACEEASTLAPDDAWPYLYKAFIYWSWRGDTENSRIALESVPREHAWAPWVWFWQEIFQGNYQVGIERLDIGSGEWIRIKIHALPKSLLAALAYELLDDTEEASTQYDRARILLEAEVQKYPDDPRFHSSLGIAYAALGQKEKAIDEGKKAVELLPISRDAMYGIPYVEDLAHIYALVGEQEAALEKLEYLLTIPSWVSVPWIELDPRWRRLRGHRRYRELMDKYRQPV